MTDDGRNSLIAVTCVTALAAASLLFLWLSKGVELPSWTPLAAFGLALLNVLVGLRRWRTVRSRRRQGHIGRT